MRMTGKNLDTDTYTEDSFVNQACSKANIMKESNHSSSSNGKSVHLNDESFLVAAYDIIESTKKRAGVDQHLIYA